MLTSFLLATAFTLAAEPNPKEQEALAALEAVGFRARARRDGVLELTHSVKKGADGKRLVPTEKELARIADLPSLAILALPPEWTTDATLDYLDNPILRQLSVGESAVTDEGLKKLARLKNLKSLDLAGTRITDEALKTLATFPSLKGISLQRTRVTDKGLEALEKSQIGSLVLDWTRVGDDGIASLGRMPALGSLSLTHTKVTDKALAEIARPGAFPKLQSLGLQETVVSDEGLKHLHDPKVLPELRYLGLGENRVTPAGVEALVKARPQVEIYFNGRKPGAPGR